MVSVMVECRARLLATTGATPERASRVMNVCRSAWKSTTRSEPSLFDRKVAFVRASRSLSVSASPVQASRAAASHGLGPTEGLRRASRERL